MQGRSAWAVSQVAVRSTPTCSGSAGHMVANDAEAFDADRTERQHGGQDRAAARHEPDLIAVPDRPDGGAFVGKPAPLVLLMPGAERPSGDTATKRQAAFSAG